MTRRHLPALDGIRAVAVGIVVVYHAGFPVPGDLGVSLFFVLSGFLITWLLLLEHDRTDTVSLQRFYLRRTFRIFPAYYAFLLFSFSADWFLGDAWTPDIALAGLTYTVNYFNAFDGGHNSTIAHAWSLAVEEQFYVLWPLVFLIGIRFGGASLLRTARVLVLIVLGWRALLVLSGAGSTVYVYNAFDTRFDQLAIGCVLAIVATRGYCDAIAARVSRSWWMPLLTIAGILVSRSALGETWHYSAGFTVDALLMAVLVVQLMVLSHQSAWSWLNARSVRWIGRLSYPIYLYHLWGLAAGGKLPWGGPAAEFVTGLIVTLLLSMGSYYVVERPLLRLRDRLGGRDRSLAPAAA